MESSNMNNNIYRNAKIYKIVDVGYNEQYFGSTTVELSKRMTRHRNRYRQYKKVGQFSYTSFLLFDKYGIENCKIELVEMYPCDSKEELNRREGHWIKNQECVNKIVAGRTHKEYYRDNIEYETAGKRTSKARQQQQEYRERNREKIK